jgi:hypothetical protein
MNAGKEVHSPHVDECERNEEVQKENGFWRESEERNEKEKECGEQYVHYLCGQERGRETTSEQTGVPAVESGKKKRAEPCAEEERERDKVYPKETRAWRFEISERECRPKGDRKNGDVPENEHQVFPPRYESHGRV